MEWLTFIPPPAIETELERFHAKICECFGITAQELGVLYEGEFIPTGPVVESTVEYEHEYSRVG